MNARDRRSPADRNQALASVPSSLNVLAGIWLAVATATLDHSGTVAGLETRWVDLAVGLAIVAVALTRAIAPRAIAPRAIARAGWITMIVLGTWLVTAPLLLDHGGRSVVVNDVVVGVVVVALTCLSLALIRRARPDLDEDRQVGDSARFR